MKLGIQSPSQAETLLKQFIRRYVDQTRLPRGILLWNSLKPDIPTVCRPFSQIKSLPFLQGKALFLYDERQKNLWQTGWEQVVSFVDQLEPWEESIDFLLFDESLAWFVAITHEDLLTLLGGSLALPQSISQSPDPPPGHMIQ